MTKIVSNTNMMQEPAQVLSLEDTILGPLKSQIGEESSKARRSKKGEKKLNLSNSILLDVITDQTRAKLVWQCIAVSLFIFVITSFFICFSLYKSRENLIEKLGVIKPLEKELAESQSQTDKFKADLIKSDTENRCAQSELNNSRTEIKNLQKRLADVTQSLETLKARNAEAVKLLNGRLQNLSNQTDNQSKH